MALGGGLETELFPESLNHGLELPEVGCLNSHNQCPKENKTKHPPQAEILMYRHPRWMVSGVVERSQSTPSPEVLDYNKTPQLQRCENGKNYVLKPMIHGQVNQMPLLAIQPQKLHPRGHRTQCMGRLLPTPANGHTGLALDPPGKRERWQVCLSIS